MPTASKTLKIPADKLPRMKRLSEMMAHHNEVLHGLNLLSQQLMDEVIKALDLVNHDKTKTRTVGFDIEKGEITITDEPKILTPADGIIPNGKPKLN